MYGGRCVNPVNLLAQPEQMRYVLAHSDCKLVVVSPDWEARVRELLAGVDRPVSVIVADPDALALPGEAGRTRADARRAERPTRSALLMYTSGTTGMPKGVMLTQANLAANAQAISAEHALTPDDRVLAVLPLYHINAFAVTMLAPLAHGGSLACRRSSRPRASGTRPPGCSAAGSTWCRRSSRTCSKAQRRRASRRSRIRFCRSASAALPPEHLRAFEASSASASSRPWA